MSEETLLEILYAKNLKKTLKLMREYEQILKSGVTYEQMLDMMTYDYELYRSKEKKLSSIDITDTNAIFKKNEIESIQTNIESKEDALCKIKALSLAKANLYE